MRYSQKGLSLIELMVAMLIGLILIAGIGNIFIDSKRTYSFQQGLARIQENGRMALEFLGRDIRMAGYMGCASGEYSSVTNTLKDSATLNYDFSRGVLGYEVGSSIHSDLSGLSPAPLLNTDVIVLKGPVGDGVKIQGLQNSDQNLDVYLYPTEPGGCPSGICEEDILMATDCMKTFIFQVTQTSTPGSGILRLGHDASGDPGNNKSSWGGNGVGAQGVFGADGEVVKIQTAYYYVGISQASGQPALFMQVGAPGLKNPAREMLEGVESMKLLYGLDTGTDLVPDSYVGAASVANWDKVGAVRVQLRVRSDDGVTDAAQTYSFNGANVTDRRLRHVFVSTVGVRAKMP